MQIIYVRPKAVPFKHRPLRDSAETDHICPLLQTIGLAGQLVGECVSHFDGFVFVELVLGYQSRQVGAVHPARHVVPRRNGEERPGIVVEATVL